MAAEIGACDVSKVAYEEVHRAQAEGATLGALLNRHARRQERRWAARTDLAVLDELDLSGERLEEGGRSDDRVGD
eukprot:6191312-Pleurochrysis_carterae.AAC.3